MSMYIIINWLEIPVRCINWTAHAFVKLDFDHRLSRSLTTKDNPLVLVHSIQVTENALTQALRQANFVPLTYPDKVITLEVHQKRILYHLTGWLLSSALSRVQRDRRLGPAFLPFVNRHKHSSADEFRKAHPDQEFKGIELVVEERNVE